MRRREFIGLLSSSVGLWPVLANGQQAAIPTVGYLSSGSAALLPHLVPAFRKGLKEAGYIEGESVRVEYRWAEGDYRRLSGLAAGLVRENVSVIAAVGGTVVAQAAKSTTTSVPVVFLVGDDPVKVGLVNSFNRPEANLTGISQIAAALGAKRTELLRELLPQAKIFSALINPNNPNAESDTKEVQDAARALKIEMQIAHAQNDRELASSFVALAHAHVDGLVVSNDALFTIRRNAIAGLAAQHKIPSIYAFREYVDAGGLISYGPSFIDMYRQVGVYVGRILSGSKPADLPVIEPAKFELLVNLKTAKSLALDVPLFLQQRADEVIE